MVAIATPPSSKTQDQIEYKFVISNSDYDHSVIDLMMDSSNDADNLVNLCSSTFNENEDNINTMDLTITTKDMDTDEANMIV